LDCDVILFKPPSSECAVFVSNVPADTTQEELFNIFGQCGLVYEVHKFNPDNFKRISEHSTPTTCFSVKYYTKAAAHRARIELKNFLFNGIPCKVVASKTFAEITRPLPFPKAVEVCNHFLGFNKWSSKIVSISKAASKPASEENGAVQCECTCEVQISIPDGRFVRGQGRGRFTSKYPMKAFEVARKTSLTDARKKAFSKLAILVLTSGKVVVHVLEEEKREEQEEGGSYTDILKSLNMPILEVA